MHSPPARCIFDFNGTLSHDEPILCADLPGAFRRAGAPALVRRVLRAARRQHRGGDHLDLARRRGRRAGGARGRADPPLRRGGRRRIDRPGRSCATSSATRPCGCRSRSARAPTGRRSSPSSRAPGSRRSSTTIVAADDVANDKPHPAGYLPPERLAGRRQTAAEVVAFEDTEAGVASATGAAVRCVAVRGTLPDDRVSGGDRDRRRNRRCPGRAPARLSGVVILAIDQGTTGTTCLVVDDELASGRPRLPRDRAALPASRAGSSTIPRRSGRASLAPPRRRSPTPATRRARPRGDRDHEPARDDRRLGAAQRPAGAPGDRLAGPAHGGALRELPADLIRERTGLVPDPYFSATKLEWILARTDAAAGASSPSGRSTPGSSGS